MYPNMFGTNSVQRPQEQKPVTAPSVKEDDPIKLTQEAADIFSEVMLISDYYGRELHLLGMCGLSKYFRYNCMVFLANVQKIQHHSIDIYSVNVEASMDYAPSPSSTPKESITKAKEAVVERFESLQRVYSSMVMKGFIRESEMVKCMIDECFSMVKKLSKMFRIFSVTNWDYGVMLAEDRKLYDKMKQKEKYYGFDD